MKRACPRRNTLTMLALAPLLVAQGCHQPATDCLDRQLIGEVMMHSELAANLRALCMPGGRLSGSANAQKATRFVADKLREYGLTNVHFEPFEMITWQDRRTAVTVLDEPPRLLEGALALGNSLSTPPDGITAELIYLGKGLEADFEKQGPQLDGKFVLVGEGGLHRSRKMAKALQHGAVGMLQISTLPDLVRVGTCHPNPAPQPGVAITGNDGQALVDRLAAGEPVQVNVQIEADARLCHPDIVVGEIAGDGPSADEIIIVCAHLDSWHLAEGALDNGTGSAAILEVARVLGWANWRPRRTVRFVWFQGEEHGLHGSKAYAAAHLGEMDDIVAVVNVDMPGRPRKLATFGHPEIVDFLESVRADLAGFEITDEIADARWTASDHAPFMKEGVCAISLSGDLGPGVKYYHSTGDTYDRVDLCGTTEAAAALAVLVRRLADAPQRPTVRLDPADVRIDGEWL